MIKSFSLDIGLGGMYIIPKEASEMLRWSFMFLGVALVAAVFGFGGMAGLASSIARIVFFLFLVGFAVSFAVGRRRL